MVRFQEAGQESGGDLLPPAGRVLRKYSQSEADQVPIRREQRCEATLRRQLRQDHALRRSLRRVGRLADWGSRMSIGGFGAVGQRVPLSGPRNLGDTRRRCAFVERYKNVEFELKEFFRLVVANCILKDEGIEKVNWPLRLQLSFICRFIDDFIQLCWYVFQYGDTCAKFKQWIYLVYLVP